MTASLLSGIIMVRVRVCLVVYVVLIITYSIFRGQGKRNCRKIFPLNGHTLLVRPPLDTRGTLCFIEVLPKWNCMERL